jgi:hypothetical protein
MVWPGLLVDDVRVRDPLTGDLQMRFGAVRKNSDRITDRYLFAELGHTFEAHGMIDFIFRPDAAAADLGKSIADRKSIDRCDKT